VYNIYIEIKEVTNMAVIINESFKSMCLQNLITKLQEDNNYNLDIDKLKRSRTFKRMLKLYIKMCSQSLHTYDSRNEVEEIMQQCYNNLGIKIIPDYTEDSEGNLEVAGYKISLY
jgi:hypothetical protein